ncbi:MAG: DUF998 domain-containing protein [Pseudonocardia sp.]
MPPPDAPSDAAAAVAPGARAAVLAMGGMAAAVLAALLVGSLHVIVGPDEVDPVRRTISEYALGDHKAMFDAGVLSLAAGSVIVLVALAEARLLRVASAPSLLLATWSIALVLVVAFEKIDWSVGPTAGGYLHRYASLVAFLALPLAGLLLALRHRRGWPGAARWTGMLSVLALAWLAPILLGFALRPLTGVPWWRFVPLGLVERGLAVTEVAVVFALGWWAWSAGRAPAAAREAVS